MTYERKNITFHVIKERKKDTLTSSILQDQMWPKYVCTYLEEKMPHGRKALQRGGPNPERYDASNK